MPIYWISYYDEDGNEIVVGRLVKCKDCKYAEHWYRDKALCFLWNDDGIGVFEDGYCNYGERREDAKTD